MALINVNLVIIVINYVKNATFASWMRLVVYIFCTITCKNKVGGDSLKYVVWTVWCGLQSC